MKVEVVLEVPKPGGEAPGFHAVVYAAEVLILLLHCCHGSVAVGFKLCLSFMVAVVAFDFGECAGIKSTGRCSQGVVSPPF